MYQVTVKTRNFRRRRFLQRIKPDEIVNAGANPLGMIADPGRVERINAPPYSRLTKG